MLVLSESVERKFTDVIDLSDWEIETPEGWSEVNSIMQTVAYDKWRVEFDDGLWIDCADNHILILKDGSQCFAKDLKIGDEIQSVNGSSKVISCYFTGIQEQMYDVEVNSESHLYYSNGLVSHNTTTVASYILWYSLFHENKTAAILANKAASAREVLSRVKDMYELLPPWMQHGIKTWNKGDIELENGSKVFCAATSASGIRGRSVNLLAIDEAAIIPNNVADEFFAATFPTISSGKTTKVVITSTPLGYNHFWKMWNDASNKNNEFVQFFAPWNSNPNRDERWLEEQRKNLGELRFNQEILCSFLGSSLTLINSSTLDRLSYSIPIAASDNLKVYHNPIPGNTYCLVADPSEGISQDYSAFSIIDITELPYRVVATFRDNTISPNVFPNIIHKVATSFNKAYVLLEVNKMEMVANLLYNELEYENILFVNKGKNGKIQEIGGGFGHSRLGVVTDKRVKRLGCSTLKELVENDKLLIEDAEIISELSTFIETKGSYAADDGYHDDLVMTLVLFSWATTCNYFKDLSDKYKRNRVYGEIIRRAEEDLTPFGFVIDGTGEESVTYSDKRLTSNSFNDGCLWKTVRL